MKANTKKATIGIAVVALMAIGIALFAMPQADRENVFGQVPGEEQGNSPSGGVSMQPGSGAILYEELDLSESWSAELEVPEKTYLQLDVVFDEPVNIRLFAPLTTEAMYVREFSHRGWVTEGMGSSHTLTITPQTKARGTVMITELGRL